MLDKFEKLAESGNANSQAVMALQLADLFVSKTDAATSEEQGHFDFIIKHVTRTASADITARIAERVARTSRVSEDTADHLSRSNDLNVAKPVLKYSP